jgi:hypothetical protein
MRNVALVLGAVLGVALIGSPAYASVCAAALTPPPPGNNVIFNVSTTECSEALTSPSAGAYLEVSTAPPAGTIFDLQVNSGSTLNSGDAVQTYTTDFALFFGPGTYTLGVYLSGANPTTTQTDFLFTLTDVNGYTLDGSYATPLPAALPLFASGLGAIGFFGWRKKRKASLATA